jgi:hypothetical protein
VQHRDVGVGALLPADQDPAESIHPAMAALDHPAACPEAGGLLDRVGLLAATTDVSREAKLRGERPDLVVVVALVQTETLGVETGRSVMPRTLLNS